MITFDARCLLRAAGEVLAVEPPGPRAAAARELAAAVSPAPGETTDLVAIAGGVRALFETLMARVSEDYFGVHWTPELEFSLWARASDDRRAWGYGSEPEIAPLRWLAEVTGCWFDGHRLVNIEDWRPRFEAWAEGQLGHVRAHTPGALGPPAFLPPPEGGEPRLQG